MKCVLEGAFGSLAREEMELAGEEGLDTAAIEAPLQAALDRAAEDFDRPPEPTFGQGFMSDFVKMLPVEGRWWALSGRSAFQPCGDRLPHSPAPAHVEGHCDFAGCPAACSIRTAVIDPVAAISAILAWVVDMFFPIAKIDASSHRADCQVERSCG